MYLLNFDPQTDKYVLQVLRSSTEEGTLQSGFMFIVKPIVTHESKYLVIINIP